LQVSQLDLYHEKHVSYQTSLLLHAGEVVK